MAANQLNKVVRYLRDILPTQAGSPAADGELLRGYVKRRDEAAFESLVKRHGPMVLGVCLPCGTCFFRVTSCWLTA